MKQKIKDYKNVFLILSIISLTLIVFIGSLSSLLLNKGYYESLYKKTGTYDRIAPDIASNKTAELFLFFKNEAMLDPKFYTKEEISHLNDVKTLVKNVFIIYYLALLLFLISIIVAYKYLRTELSEFISKIMLYSGITITLMVLSLFLFSFFDFGSVFERFHKLFFEGNYTFPSSSNMIQMWSEYFFRLFAEKIFIISAVKGIVLFAAGGLILWKRKSLSKKK